MKKKQASRLLRRLRAFAEDFGELVDGLPPDTNDRKLPRNRRRDDPPADIPDVRDIPRKPDVPTEPEPEPKPDDRLPPVLPPPARPPTLPQTGTPPAMGVSWKARDVAAPQVRWFDFGAPDRAWEIIDGLEFRCYTRTVPGINAWCVTVAAINYFEGRGCAYFESFKILDGNKTLEAIEGRHVILPRFGLVRRFYLGPEADQLASWENVDDYRVAPAWATGKARTALKKAGRLVVGPFEFFWKFRSLDNSHGGHGVAPFHGTADDWLTCPEGRRLREKEMLGASQRPFWLGPEVRPQPYWLGQTRKHFPEGYRDMPDDWCSYAQDLSKVRAADHTHWSRSWAAADALGRWDEFARDIMLAHWRDFKLAHDLSRPVEQGMSLLWPLHEKIRKHDGPESSGEGDRGLAHKLRFLRRLRDYVPEAELQPYEDAMREWVRKLADSYGVTVANPNQKPWLAEAGMSPPWTYTFHVQLNCYEFDRFGGLDDIARALREFLTDAAPKAFEWRDGDGASTCFDRKNLKPDDYPGYSSMIWGGVDGKLRGKFDTPAEFLAAMKGRGCNGASQDLDCVPRALWEPGL